MNKELCSVDPTSVYNEKFISLKNYYIYTLLFNYFIYLTSSPLIMNAYE